jgi:hypothetical protein
VVVSHACENFVNGRLVGPFYRRDRALLEKVDSSDALPAIYIVDEACWALAGQQLVHRQMTLAFYSRKHLVLILSWIAGLMREFI